MVVLLPKLDDNVDKKNNEFHDPGIDFHRQYNQKKEPSKNERLELFRAMSFLSHIAITIAACIILGVLLGMLFDNLFGTSPWLLLVFSFLGMAAAFKSLFDIGTKK